MRKTRTTTTMRMNPLDESKITWMPSWPSRRLPPPPVDTAITMRTIDSPTQPMLNGSRRTRARVILNFLADWRRRPVLEYLIFLTFLWWSAWVAWGRFHFFILHLLLHPHLFFCLWWTLFLSYLYPFSKSSSPLFCLSFVILFSFFLNLHSLRETCFISLFVFICIDFFRSIYHLSILPLLLSINRDPSYSICSYADGSFRSVPTAITYLCMHACMYVTNNTIIIIRHLLSTSIHSVLFLLLLSPCWFSSSLPFFFEKKTPTQIQKTLKKKKKFWTSCLFKDDRGEVDVSLSELIFISYVCMYLIRCMYWLMGMIRLIYLMWPYDDRWLFYLVLLPFGRFDINLFFFILKNACLWFESLLSMWVPWRDQEHWSGLMIST